jgi:hypothetical protein
MIMVRSQPAAVTTIRPPKNINLRRVPIDLWTKARADAFAMGMSLRQYIILLLQISEPTQSCLQTNQYFEREATKDINIRDVPNVVWDRARQNAIASERQFKAYVLELIQHGLPNAQSLSATTFKVSIAQS